MMAKRKAEEPQANLDDPTVVVGKDPSQHYRWVEHRNVGRHKQMGYSVVTREAAEAVGLEAPQMDRGRTDHLVGYEGMPGGGGMVLMVAPKGVVDARLARRHQQNRQRGKVDVEAVLTEAVREGVMTERQAEQHLKEYEERRG